jgi:hypothetical protein
MDALIPVAPAPEPAEFNAKVRQPGLDWLHAKGWALNESAPEPSELPPYWRAMNKDLWVAYRGVCAYLCIFFDWSVGATTTDHFVAKSSHAGLAYEWPNYRLSCLGANRRKNRFDDVLDPFTLQCGVFQLNLVNGQVLLNAALPADEAFMQLADSTIKRLGLNDEETKAMRASHVTEYLNGHVSADYLRRHSPFVWLELQRQGML